MEGVEAGRGLLPVAVGGRRGLSATRLGPARIDEVESLARGGCARPSDLGIPFRIAMNDFDVSSSSTPCAVVGRWGTAQQCDTKPCALVGGRSRRHDPLPVPDETFVASREFDRARLVVEARSSVGPLLRHSVSSLRLVESSVRVRRRVMWMQAPLAAVPACDEDGCRYRMPWPFSPGRPSGPVSLP